MAAATWLAWPWADSEAPDPPAGMAAGTQRCCKDALVLPPYGKQDILHWLGGMGSDRRRHVWLPSNGGVQAQGRHRLWHGRNQQVGPANRRTRDWKFSHLKLGTVLTPDCCAPAFLQLLAS